MYTYVAVREYEVALIAIGYVPPFSLLRADEFGRFPHSPFYGAATGRRLQ